jgi:DNA-binding MarR family transcriptional regulator
MNQDDTPFPIDYQALAELRFHIRRFLRFSEQVARSAEIEPQQYQLLLAIKGLPAGIKPTIGELAERLQLQHNSTVELADRLVDRRLIERQRDPHDQRYVILILTAEGEALLQQLAFYHRAELQTVGPALLRALEAILAPQSDISSPSLDTPQESR